MLETYCNTLILMPEFDFTVAAPRLLSPLTSSFVFFAETTGQHFGYDWRHWVFPPCLRARHP